MARLVRSNTTSPAANITRLTVKHSHTRRRRGWLHQSPTTAPVAANTARRSKRNERALSVVKRSDTSERAIPTATKLQITWLERPLRAAPSPAPPAAPGPTPALSVMSSTTLVIDAP